MSESKRENLWEKINAEAKAELKYESALYRGDIPVINMRIAEEMFPGLSESELMKRIREASEEEREKFLMK